MTDSLPDHPGNNWVTVWSAVTFHKQSKHSLPFSLKSRQIQKKSLVVRLYLVIYLLRIGSIFSIAGPGKSVLTSWGSQFWIRRIIWIQVAVAIAPQPPLLLGSGIFLKFQFSEARSKFQLSLCKFLVWWPQSSVKFVLNFEVHIKFILRNLNNFCEYRSLNTPFLAIPFLCNCWHCLTAVTFHYTSWDDIALSDNWFLTECLLSNWPTDAVLDCFPWKVLYAYGSWLSQFNLMFPSQRWQIT